MKSGLREKGLQGNKRRDWEAWKTVWIIIAFAPSGDAGLSRDIIMLKLARPKSPS